MDLAAFLLARIAEDERRVYRADSDGEYRIAWATFRQPDGSMGYTTVASDHNNDIWVANGKALYEMTPEPSVGEPVFEAKRVLAECEAKRRIVKLASDPTVMSEISDDVLRILALPYAGHPDYRDEWRP